MQMTCQHLERAVQRAGQQKVAAGVEGHMCDRSGVCLVVLQQLVGPAGARKWQMSHILHSYGSRQKVQV